MGRDQEEGRASKRADRHAKTHTNHNGMAVALFPATGHVVTRSQLLCTRHQPAPLCPRLTRAPRPLEEEPSTRTAPTAPWPCYLCGDRYRVASGD